LEIDSIFLLEIDSIFLWEIDSIFLWEIDSMGSSPLASILTNASSLEDLSLSLSRSAMEIEGEMGDLERLSHHLFQRLLTHTKLRRVNLMGGWVFNLKHLINFLKKHATTIRSLLFQRPSINSVGPEAWATVLPEIATYTKGTLEYLFIDTLIYKSSRLSRFCWSANVTPEDFGQFDCVIRYWRNRKRMELLKPEDAHTKNEDTFDD
jgi:hypothetical protein